MKKASYDYIIKMVSETNILPVTSSCISGCVFCSHRNNPGGIDAYSLPELSFEDIKDISEFLDRGKKIVIGESASRIIEGEPFLRPDMLDILKFLRITFPSAPIEVTTSGFFLDHETVKSLKAVKPIEVNLSLNSSSKAGRSLLFKGRDDGNAIRAAGYLSEEGIPFNGSIVAMPDLVGYGDIKDTAEYLCGSGAVTVRIFVPGFSGLSNFKIDFDGIRKHLQEISDEVYEKYRVPVLVEPPEIANLDPVVSGVIAISPADECGILKGDMIAAVDGRIPMTRVDAYNILVKKKDPVVQVERDGRTFEIHMKKESGHPSGAVFYYDIDPDTVYAIQKAADRERAASPAVITSQLAFPVISMAMEKILRKCMPVYPAENRWFGGSIKCAGLLTVDDIAQAICKADLRRENDLVILPPAPFDIYGRDLSGQTYYAIEEMTGIRTVIPY